jgi:hypothetical protein
VSAQPLAELTYGLTQKKEALSVIIHHAFLQLKALLTAESGPGGFARSA